MSAENPPRSNPVAERSARSFAGLLLAITLVSVLASGERSGPVTQRAALRIDPNRATRAELMLLPDIGAARADAILTEREADGREFASPTDLDRVRGIGPRRLEKLLPHLRIESPAHEQP